MFFVPQLDNLYIIIISYDHMTITVSVSDFRNNVFDHLSMASRGGRVVIQDKKRKKIIATLIGERESEVREYQSMLKRVAGVFTAKNHPEWATRAKVDRWLRKVRLSSNRNFDDYPGL